MKKFVRHVALVAGMVVLTAMVAAAQGRGRGNGPPETPPGQERKILSVPEPATISLISVAAALVFWYGKRHYHKDIQKLAPLMASEERK